MLWESFEIAVPMRVDGAIDLETAANPVDEFFFAFFDGGFGGVMDAGEADAFFHQRVELLEMIVLEGRVTTTAVCVDDDGVSAIKCFGVVRPAIAVNN